ncbi:GLIPR1-like protein 1 [Branchiostoma floridae x Branchiostoma japonicum]
MLQSTPGPDAFGHGSESEHRDSSRVTRRSAPELTREELGIIVDKHNELRKGAEPPASNMEYMLWHEELAGMAQEWSERCTWDHGQPHRDRSPFSWVGQNLWLGTTWTQGSSIHGAIQAWYNEVSYYDYDSACCAHDKVCGHYTQVRIANHVTPFVFKFYNRYSDIISRFIVLCLLIYS